jgi:hypothetical protein
VDSDFNITINGMLLIKKDVKGQIESARIDEDSEEFKRNSKTYGSDLSDSR